MTNSDVPPSIAQAPPEDPKDWKSPTLIVNGYSLTIEEYYKNPTYHNKRFIPQTYLNSVYQSLPKETIQKCNLDLSFILQKNKKKIGDFS